MSEDKTTNKTKSIENQTKKSVNRRHNFHGDKHRKHKVSSNLVGGKFGQDKGRDSTKTDNAVTSAVTQGSEKIPVNLKRKLGKKPQSKKHTKIKSKSEKAKVSGVNLSDGKKGSQMDTKVKDTIIVSSKDAKKRKSSSDLVHTSDSALDLGSSEKKAKYAYKLKKKRKRENLKTSEGDSIDTVAVQSKTGKVQMSDHATEVKKHSESDKHKSKSARKERKPLTDRQKHKRWKLQQKRKQKRGLKHKVLEQTKTEQKTVKPDVSKTIEKDSKPKFEKIVLPKSPEDASLNWKKLHPILEAKKENDGKKKKQKPHALRRKPNKEKKGRKKKLNNQEPKTSKPAEKSAPDIWFDDVDEIYLEPSARSKPPVLLEQAAKPDLTGKDNEKAANVAKNPLVKPAAYKGLTKMVGMDCEMVGVGDGSENMLARVSIVNQHGEMVYDKFVKPMENVVDYRTHVSGVRKEDIEAGEEFSQVQQDVAEILKGRILVGHALENDLKVLFLSHPKKRIRDTSRYKPFRQLFQGRTPSLKKLTAQVLNVQVQEGEHNSVQDAQAAMRLYTRYRQQWEGELSKKRKRLATKAKDNIHTDKTWKILSTVNEKKDKFRLDKKKDRSVFDKRKTKT